MAFYLLTSLAVTSGLGPDKVADRGLLGANVVIELSGQYLVPWFDSFLLAIIAMAGMTGALAFTNYVARLLFDWGRVRRGWAAASSWMYMVDAVLLAIIYAVAAIAGAVLGHRVRSGPVVKHVAPLIVVALIGVSIKAQFL